MCKKARKLLTREWEITILSLVTKFQILARTGTAGGPEGPPLIFAITVKKEFHDDAGSTIRELKGRNFEDAFDDSKMNEVWTHEAMKGHEFWSRQRTLAASFLKIVSKNDNDEK